MHHAEGLLAANDESIWRFMPRDPLRTVEDFRRVIQEALDARAVGRELAFATISKADGQIAGSTRYLDIQPIHRSLEVGWTWLGPAYQRTAINTECKYLLFRHAFETLGAVRVFLKTDARNLRSQAAIERVGAKREGTLRKHMRLPNGTNRDSVYFSVIDDEWPELKAKLQNMLS